MYYLGVEGGIVAEVPNPSVSTSLLLEIQKMRANGLREQDIFAQLHSRTVPAGYTYKTWKPSKIIISNIHYLTFTLHYGM